MCNPRGHAAPGWRFLVDQAGSKLHHRRTRLVSAALKGRATRIPRAILIHHFLFHQNRLGLPYSEPVIIAAAVTKAVFDG